MKRIITEELINYNYPYNFPEKDQAEYLRNLK